MDRFFAEHDPAARTRLRTRLAHHMFDAIKRGDWHADAATRAEIETLAGAPPSVSGADPTKAPTTVELGSEHVRARGRTTAFITVCSATYNTNLTHTVYMR